MTTSEFVVFTLVANKVTNEQRRAAKASKRDAANQNDGHLSASTCMRQLMGEITEFHHGQQMRTDTLSTCPRKSTGC